MRLIIQAAPSHERNRITFIIESDDIDAVKTLIPAWKKSKTAGRVEIDTDVAKIAIVGSRIASTPGLAARMFTALADRSINIDCISTSEMKVRCIIAEKSPRRRRPRRPRRVLRRRRRRSPAKAAGTQGAARGAAKTAPPARRRSRQALTRERRATLRRLLERASLLLRLLDALRRRLQRVGVARPDVDVRRASTLTSMRRFLFVGSGLVE